ncbi:MAG TPA: valine--tRNA ligase [Xanthobacteraceae bacterium]|jgi:valyl-tRNA synthetase|nr:valine--tRNA ligase [Xanthobacteraceae bacterium]
MIESRYQPSQVESRIYAAWEAAGAFRAGRPERAKAEPYCIVIPPPNVTGSLHMGHALNNTLQDILCRFERMRGKDVLWQPGMDHAGIATQAVVERQLADRKQPSSREMGREAFIKRVWEWKAESGGTIISQLKRLGASCDWSRERFTMDEGLSRAVRKVFVALYREGLIYKDKRLVNWDPKLKTAISDLEVQQVESKGQLWHIKYPIEGSDEFIVVATTRPETMLGDVAVAVHPRNERLKHLIGKMAILPLVGRRIPIIGDEYADPEKGSGAVKITPAHDFNDFEVWQRHKGNELKDYEPINVLTPSAKISIEENKSFWENTLFSERTGSANELMNVIGGYDKEGEYVRYRVEDDQLDRLRTLGGLDRFVARKKIVELLEAEGLVDKIEPTIHAVPHGDRSGAVLEPYLTDQWYVDAKTLAQPAMAAVRGRKTVFVPPQWEATFFNWMENIQPWCISRQIWWGHQIPAWYGPEDGVFVELLEADAVTAAQAHYRKPVEVTSKSDARTKWLLDSTFPDKGGHSTFKGSIVPIYRDEDVLDTWFSSALWPFSTLGWPDQTPELKRFYPTSTLVTGFDIIFFWVARMMMMGLQFMREVPFRDVYIHALVRDERGQKMSKSKGNVIDPLAVIDEYGADALRFTLAAMAAQGRDIKLSAQRVEGYRNFATKLWNAARFTEINGCARDPAFDPRKSKEILNRWIAHETAKATREVTAAVEAYKFNDAAAAIYRFVWNVYCDWYLELIKPVLTGPDGSAQSETQAAAAWALDQILKLLHPFMPFVTEELWTVTGAPKHDPLLTLSQWPSLEGIGDPGAETEIGWVIDLITAIRSVRAEMNVNVALPLVMIRVGDHVWERAQRWSEFIKRMAKISSVTRVPIPKPGTLQLVVRGEIAGLELAGLVDLAAERARLAKEMAKCDADIARVDAKLGNPNFVARAPEEVVEEEKEKREEAQLRKAKIAEALQRLEGAA